MRLCCPLAHDGYMTVEWEHGSIAGCSMYEQTFNITGMSQQIHRRMFVQWYRAHIRIACIS